MDLDAGEAIVFSYGQPVELDGQDGLSAGKYGLVEKKKSKYHLRDFTERGKDEDLGFPEKDGAAAPLIDVLHRVLWIIENRPAQLKAYLEKVKPDRDRLRLVAQALAGTALQRTGGGGDLTGGDTVYTTQKEHSALTKLLANWRSLMELEEKLF
jgi:putative DNA methylase